MPKILNAKARASKRQHEESSESEDVSLQEAPSKKQKSNYDFPNPNVGGRYYLPNDFGASNADARCLHEAPTKLSLSFIIIISPLKLQLGRQIVHQDLVKICEPLQPIQLVIGRLFVKPSYPEQDLYNFKIYIKLASKTSSRNMLR
jgi:hypothetical protein